MLAPDLYNMCLSPVFQQYPQVWNDELAQVAQNHAEQCVFEHNADRLAQQNTFSSVGENLAAGSGPANFTGFVQSWYNEVQDYNFNSNTCTDVCGHYTQVNHYSEHIQP